MNLSMVIVTFNRLEKLKKALDAYCQQTVAPNRLIVVDNCSSDGTGMFLDEWSRSDLPFEAEVIHASENLGGSGGFYLGEKRAMELKSDWVFVADDDAYPARDMVEQFERYVGSHDCTGTSAICAAVHAMAGWIACSHRDYSHLVRFWRERHNSSPEDYKQESFEFDLLSYVGSFMNGKALAKVGLVDPRYFIFYDDSEHSLRLQKWGKIVCVPAISIAHEEKYATKEKVASDHVTWKDYYRFRNELHMTIRHSWLAALVYFRFYLLYFYLYKPEPAAMHEVHKAAFWDAFCGRLGKHPVYQPGWEG